MTTGTGTTLRVLGDNAGFNASLTAATGFTNNGTIELTSADSFRNATLVVTSGTLVNASGAAIQSLVGTDGGRTLTAELDNQGTLTVNHPLTINKTSANHQNSSNINLSGGSLTVNSFSSFSNTGSIDAPTDNLTLSGFTSFTNTGSVTVGAGGTLPISGGTFNQNAGTFDVSNGTLSMSIATLNYTGAFTTSNTTVSLLGSTFAATGTLTHAASGTLTLNGSTVSGALDNQGTVVARGLSSLNGAVTTGTGTTLRVLGDNAGFNASLTVATGFTNNGTIELTSADSFKNATLVVSSGTLVNASGAAIQSLVGTDGFRTLTAELDNQGTLTVNQPLTINKVSASHTNSNAVNLSGGSLTVNSFSSFSNTGSIDAPTDNLTLSGFTSFTNTGSVTVGAGGTLTISGGTFNQNAGTFDVSNGTLSLNSATLNFTGAFTTANTTVSLLGSTFAATGTLTHAASGTLTLNDSAVSGALDNQGTVVARGLSSLNGAVTTGTGTTLRVLGDNAGFNASLTAATGFTNNGTIELTSADSFKNATLVVSSGTLVNASGAAIQRWWGRMAFAP